MLRSVLAISLAVAFFVPASGRANEPGAQAAKAISEKSIRTLENTLGLSSKRPLRVSRAGFQLAADEGCTDALPYSCNGANMCCDTPSIYYCENYQGPIKEMRGRSGCVKAGASDEAIKDFSQSCTRFTSC